jgi:DNA-binding MarR family transcriptional regulator
MESSANDCSREILDVIPAVMHAIRAEMRAHREPGLSVAQFRALLYINRTPGASLAQLAAHLGLTSATTCKLVDGLVERGLTSRADSPSDRRRIILALSTEGEKSMDSARLAAQDMLSLKTASMNDDERAIVFAAMQILRSAFM